eukprot:COSAG02_NODE_1759_length_11042_cov_3.648725_12_plen_60_part_00
MIMYTYMCDGASDGREAPAAASPGARGPARVVDGSTERARVPCFRQRSSAAYVYAGAAC